MDASSQFHSDPAAYSVWVEVELGVLTHNLRRIAGLIGDQCRIMAVVKADGYGHGAAAAAKAFLDAGAAGVAVSTIEEGVALRQQGVAAQILCFAPPMPSQVDLAVREGLTVTVHERAQLPRLHEAVRRVGKPVCCHLKVDTGMGRLGAPPEEALSLAQELHAAPGLEWEGVYTHFATAQERDPAPLLEQWLRFRRVLRQLREAGLTPPVRHCANSAALLRLPECRLDLVRPGTALYGDQPAPFLRIAGLKLASAFRLCARVAAIRDVPAGTSVGYGGEWKAPRPARLGVLPVGYADGLSLLPAARTPTLRAVLTTAARQLVRARSGRYVLFGDRPAPLVGRIGMQLCSVDLTDLPDVRVGDVATVPCRKTAVASRIPRVYLPARSVSPTNYNPTG